MPTTLRVLSTTTETCLLTAALDQALAERDVWRDLAEDRLRSLRVSRAVLERVLIDVAVSENVGRQPQPYRLIRRGIAWSSLMLSGMVG